MRFFFKITKNSGNFGETLENANFYENLKNLEFFDFPNYPKFGQFWRKIEKGQKGAPPPPYGHPVLTLMSDHDIQKDVFDPVLRIHCTK